MSYYENLAGSEDAARRVGWLRRVGQAYRFECVNQMLRPGQRVVDLGCGDAALARYLRASGHRNEYVGVELRESAVRGLAMPDGATIVVDDIFGFEFRDADFAVGLGCLVDGEERTDEVMMRRSVGLVRQMKSASAGILVAIDLDTLPAWRDPALGGIRARWFNTEWASPELELKRIARAELAVGWGGTLDPERARRAVESGPWGPWDPAELAWLAERCGALRAAASFLEEDVEDRALARLVGERLEAVS